MVLIYIRNPKERSHPIFSLNRLYGVPVDNGNHYHTKNIAQKRQVFYQAHRDISYTNYSSRNKACENDSQSAARPSATYLEIAAVPQPIALAPDRFYIWLLIDFERWAIPIQLTELEGRALLPLVDGERDRAVILKIVESAMNGGAV